MSTKEVTPASRSTFVIAVDRWIYWISRHWLLIFNVPIGLYIGLPWLAPLFMQLGWTTAGYFIYLIYSTQCHQLPQRSYTTAFLFSLWPEGDVRAVRNSGSLATNQRSNHFAPVRSAIGNLPIMVIFL